MKRMTDEYEQGRKYLVIEKRADGRFEMGHYNLDGEEVLAMLKWGLEAAAKRIAERVGEILGGPPPVSNTGRGMAPGEERTFFFHQPRRVKPRGPGFTSPVEDWDPQKRLELVEDLTPAPTPVERKL